MELQKVRTENISAAAEKLYQVNAAIDSRFSDVSDGRGILGSNWNSAAGTAAKDRLSQLCKGSEARFAVMENYVTYLRRLVAPGYESAETANTNLSDLFL